MAISSSVVGGGIRADDVLDDGSPLDDSVGIDNAERLRSASSSSS